jgi:membrane protease YdiL (CAAX protease family)
MAGLNLHTVADEMRNHLPATISAALGLFACAFDIPAIFRAAGFPQPVQSALPEAPLWVLVPIIVLLGPWGEELVFRRWLIRAFQWLSLSFLVASLLSTAFWVAAHVPSTVQAGLIYASTGLILCFLLYKTERLWTCVVAHMIYNVPAVFLLLQQSWLE